MCMWLDPHTGMFIGARLSTLNDRLTTFPESDPARLTET